MPSFALQIGLAIITASISAGVGWWLRGCMAGSKAEPLPEVDLPEPEPETSETELKAKETLAQLHSLAEEVASDVGVHSEKIQQINDELAGNDPEAAAVANAVTQLLEANQQMQRQLENAEARLATQANQMESFVAEARTDALTQIPNRRAFDEFCEEQHESVCKDGRPVCLLLMDVDKFKLFNDTHGHQAGDTVLKGVAKTLDSTMRDRDLVARYGGEEFTVVFPGSSLEEASAAADRARQAIEAATFVHEGTELNVTASFGVAQLCEDEPVEETVKRADDALYVAKEAGRNNTHWHDGENSHPLKKANTTEPTAKMNAAVVAATTDNGFDAETGISNRRSFEDDVLRRVSEWKRGGATLSLIFIGIDDLASIVNEYGDMARGMTVKVATQFLKAAMRDMDHVARLSEDSFALMLPGSTIDGARAVSERLRKAIGRCSLPMENGQQLQFTVSVGTAEAHRGDDFETLIQRTEAALAAAKNGGDNRSFCHNGHSAELIPATSEREVNAGV